MRVLETKLTSGAGMGKRKHKIRKSKSQEYASDSSDEGAMAVTRCSHLHKSINQNVMRKTLRRVGIIGDCTACRDSSQRQDESSHKPDISTPDNDGLEGMFDLAEPTVWLCLQCGNQGCDRNSRDKHALKHYETPHSSSHAVVVNLNTWIVWCYACDEEVPMQSSGKLQESVEFVRKQAGTGGVRPDLSMGPSLSAKSPVMNEAVVDPGNSRDDHTKPNKLRPSPFGSTSGLLMTKVKGLSNLGNTCFFNAVIQNLSQTPLLEGILADQGRKGATLNVPSCSANSDVDLCSESDDDKSADIDDTENGKVFEGPLQITLGEAGALTQSVTTFLRDMNSPSKNSTISPSGLFGQVCRKAPRFKGYQQQDSHELLRHLLDGMKAEEIKRSQAGILKAFHLPENVNPRKVDEDTKLKLKAYGRQVKHTFVDNIFGGSFISTVLCEDCNTPSQIFEPFLDISLPIMEEKVLRPMPQWSAKGKGSTVNMAVDGAQSAYTEESYSSQGQCSKHLSKKEQRKAKKEAKRKDKGNEKQKDGVSTNPKTTECASEDRCSSAEIHKSVIDGEKNRSDSLTQSDDDVSDADIEDNIESDMSRNRFKTFDLTSDATSLKSLDSDVCCTGSQENVSVDKSAVQSPRTSTNLDISKGTGAIYSEKSAISLNRAQDRDTNGETTSKDSGISIGDLTSILKSTRLDDIEKIENDKGAITSSAMTNEVSKVTRHEKSRRVLHKEAQMRAMKSLAPRYHPVSHECSIKSCLNQFTQPELLTGNNKFGCLSCTKRKHGRHVDKEGKKELVYSNASKQILIFCPPAVLTLHLKRFQQVGFRLRKVNKHVDFPLVLDVAPYCSSLSQSVKSGQSQVLYALYGVVEHSGQLNAGHFTAYVKMRPGNHLARIQNFLTQVTPCGGCADLLLQQLQLMSKDKCKSEGGVNNHEGGTDEVVNNDDSNVLAGKWYYISDSRVNEVVNESSVLNCQAYILFYERIV